MFMRPIYHPRAAVAIRAENGKPVKQPRAETRAGVRQVDKAVDGQHRRMRARDRRCDADRLDRCHRPVDGPRPLVPRPRVFAPLMGAISPGAAARAAEYAGARCAAVEIWGEAVAPEGRRASLCRMALILP